MTEFIPTRREYRFRAHDLALFTASELRELAQFVEEARS